MIKVLFFAQLRELAGCGEISVSADTVSDMPTLMQALADQLPEALADALQDQSAMVSVNHRYAGWDTLLNDGDEVGLLPPVSGG